MAHIARVYDYWLGGKDNHPADQAVAEQVMQAYPDIVYYIEADLRDTGTTLAEAARRYNAQAAQSATFRARADIVRLFDGLDLVEPGVVRVPEWRPRSEIEAKSPSNLWGGVARKP